ncbi:ParA family protein [Salmonella enterica]|uniref:ParA family protein n=1 Tax=Salmonella enterica TaxID=28901 RepID=UPI0007357435|nr:ParA family protein [Salmonella enterica]HBG9387305.1 ParA family protein [Escherichia coli]EGG7966738.1 ParA family protein [Salmonella enterica]EGK5498986.1 ParA family protein [Salmonella enterica]EJB9657976.1 ParA family protein [Salmonella enterica]EKI6155033.1 ParA family protein [Salmonella enterica]
MKVLVTANQKGGVGKTSTLVHLAFDFSERGKRVAVIDMDTQGNASFTLNQFSSGIKANEMWGEIKPTRVTQIPESGISLIESDIQLANVEKLNLSEMVKQFRHNLQQLANSGFDVCLIDTAPTVNNALIVALASADFVVCPIELEVYSIQGIKKMLTTFTQVKRKMNSKLEFIGMVPSKVDGRNPRHVNHLQELQAAYPTLIVPVSVGLRSSIADALASHVPVWKIKKTAARKASQEMRALADHVFTKMEIA